MKTTKRKRINEIVKVLRVNQITQGLTPERLRNILIQLGPTYIKIGQILSMRYDLLPKEYCDALVSLQENVAPLSITEIKETLKKELGKEPEEIFLEFNPKPLGSASIAQVHEAKLKDGSHVVVKVQRPNIYETIQTDIELLYRAGRIINRVGPGDIKKIINIPEVVDQLWLSLQEEMDFKNEAKNLKKFQALNKDSHILSPKVYEDYSNKKVLVMSYMPGEDILRADRKEQEKASKVLIDNYVKQVVKDGYFHADPHPGNIKLNDNQVVYMDLGMMGEISKSDQVQIKNILLALVRKDTASLMNAILILANKTALLDESAFYEELDDFVNKYSLLSFDEIDLTEIFDQILYILNRNNLTLPARITLLMRGLITFESLISEISPKTNLIEAVSRVILKENLADINLTKELIKLFEKTEHAYSSILEIPVELNTFLNQILKGQGKLNIALMGSERPLAALAKMVNRLVIGIITAALLIGSSFIATTKMKPLILGIPALGVIGFIFSFILGSWIVIEMLIQNRTLDNSQKIGDKDESRILKRHNHPDRRNGGRN